MSRHGLLRSAETTAPASLNKRRCGEVVGGATAEFTAVVCCCPLAVVDMLALALYKAPKGMCRKAIEEKREKRKKKKAKRILKQQQRAEVGGMEEAVGQTKVADTAEETAAIEVVDLEIYDKFYGTGFWRSTSQQSGSV